MFAIAISTYAYIKHRRRLGTIDCGAHPCPNAPRHELSALISLGIIIVVLIALVIVLGAVHTIMFGLEQWQQLHTTSPAIGAVLTVFISLLNRATEDPRVSLFTSLFGAVCVIMIGIYAM